jgi:hypothetical protein
MNTGCSPSARASSADESRTIVGDIELSGRLRGATAFASALFEYGILWVIPRRHTVADENPAAH